jgi:hypothetical protein
MQARFAEQKHIHERGTPEWVYFWAKVAVKPGKKHGHVKGTITMTKGVSGC